MTTDLNTGAEQRPPETWQQRPAAGWHCMVDLETFGTGERAAIVQVGWCMFDPEAEKEEEVLGPGWQVNVNLASAVLHGGEVDADTVEDFWRPRRSQWDGLTQDGKTVPYVLDLMDAYYREFSPARTWCHGATFDVPILGSYYRFLERRTPWGYTSVRDTRTLFDLAGRLAGWERPQRDVNHFGLADARAQALDVWAASAALRGLKVSA